MNQGPQPRITEVNRPFWDGCRAGKLMLQRCAEPSCGRFVFYPRVCCPYCGGGALEWKQVSGAGRLQSWTVVHRPGHESFMAEVPYVFAAVILAEGPLIFGRLLVPPEAPSLAIDVDVHIVFPEAASGVVLPAFVPHHAS
jgi:uncharacterized OB-fold protein